MWPWVFPWVFGILYNQGNFDQKKQKKGEKCSSLKISSSTPVCAAQPSSTLSYFTRSYILGNKRKRKEADYIFIHQYCCLSLLYSTLWWWLIWRGRANPKMRHTSNVGLSVSFTLFSFWCCGSMRKMNNGHNVLGSVTVLVETRFLPIFEWYNRSLFMLRFVSFMSPATKERNSKKSVTFIVVHRTANLLSTLCGQHHLDCSCTHLYGRSSLMISPTFG